MAVPGLRHHARRVHRACCARRPCLGLAQYYETDEHPHPSRRDDQVRHTTIMLEEVWAAKIFTRVPGARWHPIRHGMCCMVVTIQPRECMHTRACPLVTSWAPISRFSLDSHPQLDIVPSTVRLSFIFDSGCIHFGCPGWPIPA